MSNIPIDGTEMLDVIVVVVLLMFDVVVASRLCIPMLVDVCKSATLVFTGYKGCLCVMIYQGGVTFTSVTIIPSLHTCSITTTTQWMKSTM